MDLEWIMVLMLAGITGGICGGIGSYVYTVFNHRTTSARLHGVEAELEGLSEKLHRRTQRENSDKASNKAQKERDTQQVINDFLASQEGIQPKAHQPRAGQAAPTSVKFRPGF